jgi:DNA-binding HxlR family transcriptional regulator
VIGGRWSLQILRQLSKGVSRPVALLSAVNLAAGEGRKLSEKIMFETLARLAADGIISRERVAGYPPQTHYRLTDSGRGILNAISRLGRSGRAADDEGSGAAAPRGHDVACARAGVELLPHPLPPVPEGPRSWLSVGSPSSARIRSMISCSVSRARGDRPAARSATLVTPAS